MYSIYKYTNKYNGKVYIGQTSCSLEERAQSNGSNYRSCPLFYAAIKEYSWDAFVPEILETVHTKREADERESYYIGQYHSQDDRYGYNQEPGGSCGPKSAGSRKKISQMALERYRNPANNPMYGKHHSEETKKKQSERKTGKLNPMFGTKWTETQRALCGTKGKTLNLSEEQREKLRERARLVGQTTGLKPVICLTDGESFESLTSAAEYYGVSIASLCDNLKGRSKLCHGRKFEYLN